MFGKRISLLVFFASVFSVATARQLDATFDLLRFKAGKSQHMVELYCSVNGNSVIYKKVPGGFQASVALEMQFSDSTGIHYFDKLVLKSPLVADTIQDRHFFNLQKRVFLKEGYYQFVAKMQDVNSAQPASNLEAPLELHFKPDAVQISDIQLLDSYEKTTEKNDYVKNGYRLLSYVSSFYPKGIDKLKFYTEIYQAESVLGKDKPMVVFYRVFPAKDNMNKITLAGQKIMKAAPVNVLLNEIDISTLASGNYQLVVEVRNEENKVVAKQQRFFQRSNPQTVSEQLSTVAKNDLPPAFSDIDSTKLSLYLLSLKPVCNATEGVFVETVAESATADQKKNYLYSFWKKRSETNPDKAWLSYEQRIITAEKNYSTKAFHAYQTDMGRVFLQYGPPNQISTERTDPNRPIQNSDTSPYQIWRYYQLDKQRNRMFAFVQRNLGNSFKLVHSTANGEINNIEWRTLAGQKFNGANSKASFDRNSSTNRNFDREGNEDRNALQDPSQQ